MAVRTIGTDIKLTGEKEFNDGMKAINSNLKNLRTDMAATSAEFDGNANSVEALTAKQKTLQESVDQSRVKVDALRQMYEKQVAAYGENSYGADKYRQKLNAARIELAKLTSDLEKNAEALDEAQNQSGPYVSILQRFKGAVSNAADSQKDLRRQLVEVGQELPVVAELMDVAKVAAKGLDLAATGAGKAAKGVATAAGGLAKGVGAVSAAAAAGAAAVMAGGVAVLGTMASYAKEAAEAAKAAKESGETLTASQEQWLAFSDQLGSLDAAVAGAKSALGSVLLPALSELSTEGAAFLNDFSRDMEAAAGDTEAQGKIMADYIVRGAKLIKEKLPEYVKLGKELFSGLGEGLSQEGPELLDMGLDLAMDLLDEIINFAPQLAEAGVQLVQKLLEGLIERGPDVMASAVGMVSQIVSGLAQAAPDLIPMAGQLVVTLITALIQNAPQLLLAGLELIYGIIAGLIDGLGYIIESADEIISALVTEFANNAERFKKIGNDIIQKIKQGLSDAWSNFKQWFLDLWNGLFGNLSVKIPVEGSKQSAPKGNLDTSFDVPDYNRPRHPGRQYTTKSGKTVNLYFYAKSITDADVQMIVDTVNRELGDDIP